MPTNEPIGMFDLVNLIMKKLFSKSGTCIFWIYEDLKFPLYQVILNFNRLWRLYTNPFTARKKSPIFFSYWHDRPAWIHQESGGVEPPTLIGGPPRGYNPNFYPETTKLKTARLRLALMGFSIFQLISTGNDLNFYIYQIQNVGVQYRAETSRQS